MINDYIPLRVNRDFGDIITTYFDFLKKNLRIFANIFLSYNGIFLVGLLVASYLLVSGFIGVIAYENTPNSFSSGVSLDEKYYLYIGSGAILFFFIFIIVAALNYGLSSSYMIKYGEHQSNDFEKRRVWEHTKSRFGNIALFMFLLVLLAIGFGIVAFICLVIPFIGFIPYYILTFFFLAWIGVSFMHMMQEDASPTDALGEGWKLVSKNFWKSVGVNFILYLLNMILQFILYIIPVVIVGVYYFHTVENNVDYASSITATIVYSLGLCLALVIGMFSYSLSQFVNGILYYALHEKTYNINTRSRIEEIGKNE